jgi:hypothetical protein
MPTPLAHPPAVRAATLPAEADRPAPEDHGSGTGGGRSPGPRGRRAGWEPWPPPPVPARAGTPQTGWPRFVRTPRSAAGFAIVAAALLLWPFAELSWIPWLIGFVALIVVRLLRLDGVLRGWDVHVAGLVVMAGLMISTTPWAWALAASIGVLIAGLVRWPAWRLAALGAVLCVLTGSGFVWSRVQTEREAAAAYAPVQERSRQDQGAPRPNGVLPILLNRIAQGSPDALCDNLLAEPVRASFAAAAGRPDCDAAVRALAAQVVDPGRYADAVAPTRPLPDGLVVDACALDWGPRPAGPQLGRLTITAVAPARYAVTTFQPCS